MLTQRDALYRLLPAYIRQRDLESGGALRHLLEIIGTQAGLLERDIERMYDNWFIETCDPWVVPYIAELLGYEPMAGAARAASPALAQVLAPRREAAGLIAHQRRKGSLLLLEELARDIAGWLAVAVECYRRLITTQHLDHPQTQRLATVDLHNASALNRIDTPFDTSCRTADVRRIGNPQSSGLYNISSIAVFAFRLRRYSVTDTSASCHRDVGLHCYSFSVLGNDVTLYRRPEPAGTQPHTEANVPLPIGRRMLEIDAASDASSAHADPALVGPGRSLSITVPDWPMRGHSGPVPPEAVIPADLTDWSYRVPKNRIAIDPRLGRIMFAASQAPRKGVKVSYGYGFAMDLGGGEYERPPLPLPARVSHARVRSADHDAPGPDEFASIAQAIEDWQTRRNAQRNTPQPGPDVAQAALFIELLDSGVYRGRVEVTLGKGESVWIVAAPRTRPVLRLAEDNADRIDAISVRGANGSRFILDGVLVAGRGVEIAPLIPEEDHGDEDHRDNPPTPQEPGDLCQILIRHSTLVPGWSLDCDCEPRHPGEPSVLLDGSHACVRIEHSIVGAIQLLNDEVDATPSAIVISDSIVDATSPTRQAIGGAPGDIGIARLMIKRSTIIGEALVHAITLAENSIFVGQVQVARRQIGCIRYCYLPQGCRTPRRHRCQPDQAITAVSAAIDADTSLSPAERAARKSRAIAETLLRVVPDFESMRYGAENYLRLRALCIPEIAQGADDESEIGVYHDLFEPQRTAMLNARLADYVPAGFEGALLFAS